MATQAPHSLLAGRYQVLRRLGSGGMATVLLCRDERLGREVAVKRLHAHSPEDVARRFAREARLGASLNHPNVVSVFDTVTDGDAVLITMEYVRGESLADALRRGPLGTGRALAIVRSIASGLDHIHAQGVVHRDVKPANILLRHDGVAKLVDLGIATAADSTRITRSGIVLGTASYMAPEQLDGREVGPAADVYALAAVAFEALGGRKARRGKTPMEIASHVVSEPPPDLRDVWPDAPPGLAKRLQRGMATDPAERPQTAGELATGLEGALRGGESVRTQTLVSQDAEAAPRHKATPDPARGRRTVLPVAIVAAALALAGAFLALSGGGGGSDQQQGSGEAERSPAKPAPERPSESSKAKSKQQGSDSDVQSNAPVPVGGGSDAALGSRLNSQGYALMQDGRYNEAVAVLRRAVDAFPAGTTDLNYAYALFNLGRSLRLAGRPAEAVPILERRLEIPNQRGVVRKELEAARKAAG